MSTVHRPLSTVFMGSPAFAVPALEVLLASKHEIVAVYSQPPRPAGRGQKLTLTPVHALAEARGIPVYTPESLKSPEIQAEFAAHKADCAVVAAYGLLLPKPILEAYRLGCINVHPSLLPRWRGAAPIQRTLMAGDVETGVCIMQMEEGLDTGPVLAYEDFSIPHEMDAGGLHDALSHRSGPLLLQTLEALAAGAITPMPQAHYGVTYAAKITKEEARIDWSRTAHELLAHIRGLSPAPGAFFGHGEETIKVFRAEIIEHYAGDALPGTVLDDMLTIACGTQALRLLEIQRPGKKRMQAQEALKGWTIPPGTSFQQPVTSNQ